MLKEAKNGNFPKKDFKKGDKTFGYTSYLHFTTSKLTSELKEKIEFVCLFCDTKQVASLGKTSNIKNSS